MHFSFIQFTLPSVSIGLILIPSWPSLAHFITLGILDPLYPFGHPWPILFLHSHKLLLHHLGFPDLITTPFAFKACWPLYQPHLLIHFFRFLRPIFACFPFLIIPMGLLLPSLGSLRPVCFLWDLFFILFYRHADHYFCHLGLMVFSYFANSSSFTPSILLSFFLLLGLFTKVGINN